MLATEKLKNRKVAIKFMRINSECIVRLLEQVFKECDILKGLNHKGIIKVFNAFAIKNFIVLVMEYAAGGELLKFLKSSHVINEDEAFIVFSQILSAVDYCHHQNIIHRDLKLENILFTDEHSNEIRVIFCLLLIKLDRRLWYIRLGKYR
jgi:serine/threonine protein kinase